MDNIVIPLSDVTLAADSLYEVHSLHELTDAAILPEILSALSDLTPSDAIAAVYLAALWHESIGHTRH